MSSAVQRVEVLIIGGGVVGSSIAYSVARQGRSVLVVERAGVAAEPAASWASAGGIRLWEQDPPEVALSHAALARWPSLAEELDADLGYRQGGHLLVAENDAEASRLQTLARDQRGRGFADVRYVNREEALRLVPGLGEQVTAGIFSPRSGQADPRLTTRAFADAARRHGAVYWTGTGCLALRQVGDRVIGAQTARGVVEAEQVVLAAGAWSGQLAASIGLRLPLRVQVLQALTTTPARPGAFQPVVSAAGRALSIKQRDDGAFVLGGGWLGDLAPGGQSYTLREDSVRGNWETACEVYPPIRALRRAGAWGGIQASTPDDLPYIGSVPGLDGLTLAVGSWYGFALSPAIGDAVADHLAGRQTPELEQLSPDRIDR